MFIRLGRCTLIAIATPFFLVDAPIPLHAQLPIFNPNSHIFGLYANVVSVQYLQVLAEYHNRCCNVTVTTGTAIRTATTATTATSTSIMHTLKILYWSDDSNTNTSSPATDSCQSRVEKRPSWRTDFFLIHHAINKFTSALNREAGHPISSAWNFPCYSHILQQCGVAKYANDIGNLWFIIQKRVQYA